MTYQKYRYKLKHWIHWKFGIHFFRPLGRTGVLPKEKESGRYIWCNFCGAKFEANPFLFERLYNKK